MEAVEAVEDSVEAVAVANIRGIRMNYKRRLWLLVLAVAALSQVGCGRLDKLSKPQATTIGGTQLAGTPTNRNNKPKRKIAPKSRSLTGDQKQNIKFAFAEVAESRGDIEQAIRTYENAQSDRPEVVLRLANLYVKQGQNERATEKFRQAIGLGADSPEAYSDFGYNLYLQQEYEEAEQLLKTALRLRPDFPRANNNLGLLFARTGRTDEALECFARAGLTESDARTNLALALLSERNTNDAVAELTAARSLDRTGKSAERIESLARVVRAVKTPNGTATSASNRANVAVSHDDREISLTSFRK